MEVVDIKEVEVQEASLDEEEVVVEEDFQEVEDDIEEEVLEAQVVREDHQVVLVEVVMDIENKKYLKK